ncbi:MAG TPA: response regulator transcription factor [Gammaproteobacteria bacterium]|nr:response regulator transcription factor [Gammaproteobacteria bacterium]
MNKPAMSPQSVTHTRFNPLTRPTRVFILGHHDFSIDGVVSMLADHEDGYLVSCIEPGNDCMEKFAEASPDVLLLHHRAVDGPLERFIHRVLGEYPEVRILVFGQEMDDDQLYRLVRAGAHGYINERMNGDHVKRALDSVTSGNAWIERHIMERFIAEQQGADHVLLSQFHDRIDDMCTQLTRRETEILSQVIRGLAIKQIAEEVHLSHQGVKMHLAKLFKKFGVSNRNQLILAAFDEISPVEQLSTLLRNGLEKKLSPH